MVFWKSYPVVHFIYSLYDDSIFRSEQCNKNNVLSPTGRERVVLCKNTSIKIIKEVREYLKTYFGNPPDKPILDIPEHELIGERDHIMIVRDKTDKIVGCIRYHYIGVFVCAEKEMYCVDCFCIHPDWRKKLVGDYLLTQLHNYVNIHDIPYSIFLKEGSKLNILHSPFYSSHYVYRVLSCDIQSNKIHSLSVKQAYRWIDIYREIKPDLFIIRNNKSVNQIWKWYRNGLYSVLACFQDAYQRIEEKGVIKKIGWTTAWIESPNMTDVIREEASLLLSATVYPTFDYIWMNKEWIGNSSAWKIDGTFQWYTYQWSSSIHIHKSYCMLN